MAYKYLNDDGLKAYTKKVKGALKDLHTTIAISIENTVESKAQNVRNIADFVAKAKAAGITDVNGMAVTCLIYDDYSGVGYLYGDTNTNICGIISYDDASNPHTFAVNSAGEYIENEVLTATATNLVTSSMLIKGARKPIILTSETTEVDEETYQKLLSDNVDVVFKTQDEDANICLLTYKYDGGDVWCFTFTCFSVEDSDMAGIYIYAYIVTIKKTAPHTCIISTMYEAQNLDGLIETVFINKSILYQVLQEIDLTGTDADRKAKLDQFEADWKALTGADDLTGARFVGVYNGYSGVFTYSTESDEYVSLTGASDKDSKIRKITVGRDFGNIIVTILFFYLEPLTIKTGSADTDVKANKFAILEYTKKLSALGVNTTNGYQVSVVVTSDGEEYTGTLNIGTGTLLMGIVSDLHETHHYPFHIEVATGKVTFDKTNYFLEKTSNEVTEMLDAIKYSYTPVPLTATTSTNKTQLDLFLSKVPNAQIMNCTYKDVYAGTLHKINGSWYGVLVSESNTLAGQLSIKLQADGTIVEGTA